MKDQGHTLLTLLSSRCLAATYDLRFNGFRIGKIQFLEINHPQGPFRGGRTAPADGFTVGHDSRDWYQSWYIWLGLRQGNQNSTEESGLTLCRGVAQKDYSHLPVPSRIVM